MPDDTTTTGRSRKRQGSMSTGCTSVAERREMRVSRWMLAVAAGLVALAFGAAPALAETLVVDTTNPELECPNADFVSISAAVAAAEPGDVIRVCPGLYSESVTVSKTLELRGSGPQPRRRSGDPRDEAVVDYGFFVGFNLVAQGVILDGFTIQGTGSGVGIRTDPAFSGYSIRRNLLHRNSFDLTLSSNGVEETVVVQNAFNNESDTAASASSFAISSFSSLANARIEHNFFTKHAPGPFSSGTAFRDASRLTFAHNKLIDDSEVVVSRGTDVTVSHNRSLRSSVSGIRVFDATRVRVAHNQVAEAAATGIVMGDEEVSDAAVIAHNRATANTNDGITVVRSSGVIVEHNDVEGNRVTGMRVSFGGGNVVRHNGIVGNVGGLNIFLETGTQVEHNVARENERNGIQLVVSTGSVIEGNVSAANGLDGILLRESSNNLVRANASKRNGKDGIEAEASSTANTILGNHMGQNAEHDCHDDSVGPGTAGTANIWLANKGKTENRRGLCKHARWG